MKYAETTYGNGKEILKFPDHYVAIPVTVDDTGVTANADGKKIVQAGLPVGGVTGAFLTDPTQKVTVKNGDGASGTAGAAADAEGVLFSDADVTNGPAPGAVLIHGYIDLDKLPASPHANAVKALAGRIVFLK